MNGLLLVVLSYIGMFWAGVWTGKKIQYHRTAFHFCEAMVDSLARWKGLPPDEKADTGRGVGWLSETFHKVLRERGLDR